MRKVAQWLAVAAAVGMFVVLVMGSTVTQTESGQGCGTDWPLCNGRFVPEFAVDTAIEYSHRVVTGIEGLLMLAASAGVWWFWRGRREVRVLVPLMLLLLVVQSGLGAGAARYPNAHAVLALHFGISLTAFASTLLTALFVFQVESGADALRDRPAPPALRWGVWGVAVYTYAVVYLGAYVNHTGASLACADWPLCGGQVVPTLAGPVGIHFAHRLAAGVLGLAVAALFLAAWRRRAARPDLAWAGGIALALVVVQSLAGAAVVLSGLNLFSALAHGTLATLLFGALSYMCFHVLPRPAAVRGRAPRPTDREAVVETRESEAESEREVVVGGGAFR